MRHLKIAAAVFFVGTVFVVSLGLRADPANTNASTASLVLISISNAPPQSIATFVLTNGTPAHIACAPEAIEQQTNGTWTRTPLLGRSQRITRSWKGVPEELRPNQAVRFTVPSPSTNAVWRLVFYCQEQRPVSDRVADVVHHIKATNSAQATSRQFSGRHYSIVSPEVRQPARN